MKKFTITISTLLFLFFNYSAQANQLLVTDVSGVLDSTYFPDGSRSADSNFSYLSDIFAVGDPFSARFIIELDTELSFRSDLYSDTVGYAIYSGGTGEINISTRSQQYSFSQFVKFNVLNDYPFASGPNDYFGAYDPSLRGGPLESGSLSFGLNDDTASMFSNYSLPLTLPNFETGFISMDFESGSLSGRIDTASMFLSSSTASHPVPITQPVWLMVPGLLALTGIGFVRRKKLAVLSNNASS